MNSRVGDLNGSTRCSANAARIQTAVNGNRCDLSGEGDASLMIHFRDAHGDITEVSLPAETHGKHVYEELRKLSPSLQVATIHSLLIKEDHETIRLNCRKA